MDDRLLPEERQIIAFFNTAMTFLVTLPYSVVPYNSETVDLFGWVLDLAYVRSLAIAGLAFNLYVYWFLWKERRRERR